MAPELLLLWLAPPIVAFFLYILPQRRRTKGKPCNLPPGSTWCLPFLGETIAFLKPREATTIGKYLKEHIARYGRIFRSSLFGEMMIVSADPELNRFVLQNEGKEFRSSYPKHVEEVLGRWTKMELEGSLQKELRRIAVAFWTRVRLREVLVGDVERHALLVVRSLPVDVPFPAKEQVRRFTFNVIVGHCLGMHGENSKTERLKVEFAKFLNNFVSLPIKFPGTTYWKCLKSRANILKVIDEEIKERIQKPMIKTSEIETQDLLGFAMDADLSSELIHDLILNMIFGGHETTTTAITFAIYFLGRSPKALEELRREHLEIVEKKKLRRESTLTWEDYKQMDFTHCVINETLRLGNTLRFLERKAIRDVHYKGYDIPSGHKLLLIFDAVHLDSSIYNDPEEFNPWRWKGQSCSTIYSGKSFMPFGGGPRVCVGWEVAKLEMAVFLHHLILSYSWRFAELDQVPMAYPYPHFPKGLQIIARAHMPI